jgi:hypothetical protein
VKIVIGDHCLIGLAVCHVEKVDFPKLHLLIAPTRGLFIPICHLVLVILLLFQAEMLVHVDHRLIPVHLLVHINFELRYRDQVPPAKIIEEHHARELPIIVTEHRANQVLIGDGHVNKVLSMLRADPTRHIEVVLVEIQTDVPPDDLPAHSDGRLQLIDHHGGVRQVADADEGLDGLPVIHLQLEGVRIDRVVSFNLQSWHKTYRVVVKSEIEGRPISLRVPYSDPT